MRKCSLLKDTTTWTTRYSLALAVAASDTANEHASRRFQLLLSSHILEYSMVNSRLHLGIDVDDHPIPPELIIQVRKLSDNTALDLTRAN
jgi:hypothetical protein